MAQSANLYVDNGSTGENVTVQSGQVDVETQVLTYSPPRGTLIRLLNQVAAGQAPGIPLQMKLRDSNGNLLPTDTIVFLEVKRAGQSSFHRISEEITNIGHYNRTSLTKQVNVDNIDQSKIELQYPEASGKSGSPSSTKVRGIDEVAVTILSSVAFDPANSVIQVATDATEGPNSY